VQKKVGKKGISIVTGKVGDLKGVLSRVERKSNWGETQKEKGQHDGPAPGPYLPWKWTKGAGQEKVINWKRGEKVRRQRDRLWERSLRGKVALAVRKGPAGNSENPHYQKELGGGGGGGGGWGGGGGGGGSGVWSGKKGKKEKK